MAFYEIKLPKTGKKSAFSYKLENEMKNENEIIQTIK